MDEEININIRIQEKSCGNCDFLTKPTYKKISGIGYYFCTLFDIPLKERNRCGGCLAICKKFIKEDNDE